MDVHHFRVSPFRTVLQRLDTVHLAIVPHFQVFLFLKILRKFLNGAFVCAHLKILLFQVMFEKYANILLHIVLHLKVLLFRMVLGRLGGMHLQIVYHLQAL